MTCNILKLENILEGGFIKPVYQPIISLSDGTIWGYEALSRITQHEFSMSIEELFVTADNEHKAWELESLCRVKALEGFACLGAPNKLFLNVNPNIIHDDKFKHGFTKDRLSALGMSEDKITFEITERVSILNKALFFESIEHYKKQNYGIAIDDVGSGFSGLNVIVDLKPRFIKIDMQLIRNIDKDQTKLFMCKALADFSKSAGIKVIAEGIESEEELTQLIKLGVDFGQGYFLGLPDETLKEINSEKHDLICSIYDGAAEKTAAGF